MIDDNGRVHDGRDVNWKIVIRRVGIDDLKVRIQYDRQRGHFKVL